MKRQGHSSLLPMHLTSMCRRFVTDMYRRVGCAVWTGKGSEDRPIWTKTLRIYQRPTRKKSKRHYIRSKLDAYLQSGFSRIVPIHGAATEGEEARRVERGYTEDTGRSAEANTIHGDLSRHAGSGGTGVSVIWNGSCDHIREVVFTSSTASTAEGNSAVRV